VKGGTVIAGDVLDREEHARRMLDPETYRPGPCAVCGRRMHGHGMRPRKPVGEAPIDIRRYTCPSCGGAVQVLPCFVARNLWRTWPVVEAVCVATPERRLTTTVAPRTVARWWARLWLTVMSLLQVLSAVRLAALTELVAQIGLDATRRDLLVAYRPQAGRLGACASLANLLNRLRPGLRVM
jgi:hypothetical protein